MPNTFAVGIAVPQMGLTPTSSRSGAHVHRAGNVIWIYLKNSGKYGELPSGGVTIGFQGDGMGWELNFQAMIKSPASAASLYEKHKNTHLLLFLTILGSSGRPR